MAATTLVKGHLEIDHERGVIYFHTEFGNSFLRICSLPPIPKKPGHPSGAALLDISHMHGVSWSTNKS